MALGKKNNDAPEAESEEAPELDAPTDDAPAGADSPERSPIEAVVAAPAEAPGSDALLSMFQESKTETDDLGVLVDLAGDADLDDILEELRTLRAALGITSAYDEEEDFAAAA